MSISSFFDTLGKDIAKAFTPTTITTYTSPLEMIATGIANAVDAIGHAINQLVPSTSPAATPIHQITDAVSIIAHDAAKTAVAISNSGSVAKIATTAIDHTVSTVTDLVNHFDTRPSTAAITQAVNSVVDNVTNIADAGVSLAGSNPFGAVHAGVQILDAVSGITSAITNAVVATNDPATLDQQAIAGVKGFSDFTHTIDQLPNTIGGAVVTAADQLNSLVHATNPQNALLGQISDGLTIVAHDIGLGLSDVLGTSSVTHIVTGSLNIATNTISDLVAHYDTNPATAGIAHTVSSVVSDTMGIVNTIADAVTSADILGAGNTANHVIGSLTHIGQTISEQIANAYVPNTTTMLTPIEQPVIL